MADIKTESFDGNISVSYDAVIGGNALIRGRARVAHSLKVEGWLDAPNIKGAQLGLFVSEAQLLDAYPTSKPGQWALVLDTDDEQSDGTFPAIIYVADGHGGWDNTHKTSGYIRIEDKIPEAEIEALREVTDSHEQEIGDLRAALCLTQEDVKELVDKTDAHDGEIHALQDADVKTNREIGEIKTSIENAENLIDHVQSEVSSMGERLDTVEGKVGQASTGGVAALPFNSFVSNITLTMQLDEVTDYDRIVYVQPSERQGQMAIPGDYFAAEKGGKYYLLFPGSDKYNLGGKPYPGRLFVYNNCEFWWWYAGKFQRITGDVEEALNTYKSATDSTLNKHWQQILATQDGIKEVEDTMTCLLPIDVMSNRETVLMTASGVAYDTVNGVFSYRPFLDGDSKAHFLMPKTDYVADDNGTPRADRLYLYDNRLWVYIDGKLVSLDVLNTVNTLSAEVNRLRMVLNDTCQIVSFDGFLDEAEGAVNPINGVWFKRSTGEFVINQRPVIGGGTSINESVYNDEDGAPRTDCFFTNDKKMYVYSAGHMVCLNEVANSISKVETRVEVLEKPIVLTQAQYDSLGTVENGKIYYIHGLTSK